MACATRSCRGRWPTGSARSRSSRPWGAGTSGIFGAAGLPLNASSRRSTEFSTALGESIPYGINLIHSPGEPEMESAVVDLLLRRRVRLVEASAFLNLTLPVVRYRVAGLGAMSRARGRGESHHRQGIAGRGRFQVHGSAARRRCSASWSPRARSRRSKRSGRRNSRWPMISRPRPIRADTPTTSPRS